MIGLAGSELSLAQIAARVGLPKSTTHRLLRTLELRGFVGRNPLTGSYRAGVKGRRRLGRCPEVHAVLRGLCDESGETANLGALVGTQIMYVDRADPSRGLPWALGVGSRVPAYCSGMGKAILAFVEPETVGYLLPAQLEARTTATITDPGALRADLALTRSRGYAVDDEEYLAGVRCVAVPVVSVAGEVAGAVSVAASAARLTRDSVAGVVPALRRASSRLAGLLESPVAVGARATATQALDWSGE